MELGALGEVVGAIAVVVSLVYLSRQVRANTDALRTANAATVQANFEKLASLFTYDREAGEIVLRGLEDDPSLARGERLAAAGWFFNALKAGELAHRQYLAGQLDEDVWRATESHFRAYWETPGIRAYWVERRGSFTPAFRSAMDGWLASCESGPTRRSDRFFGDPADSGETY